MNSNTYTFHLDNNTKQIGIAPTMEIAIINKMAELSQIEGMTPNSIKFVEDFEGRKFRTELTIGIA